jgi:hypothetical protein
VLSIATHCRFLADVTFSALAELSDDAVCALAREGRMLSSVSIAAAPGLTDVTLQAFAQHCPLIIILSLKDSVCITASGILHLLNDCKKLMYVLFPPVCMEESKHAINHALKARAM